MEKSFIAHPWIQRSVVGLEEYSAHDWRAATSSTARSSYLARVGPVVLTQVDLNSLASATEKMIRFDTETLMCRFDTDSYYHHDAGC